VSDWTIDVYVIKMHDLSQLSVVNHIELRKLFSDLFKPLLLDWILNIRFAEFSLYHFINFVLSFTFSLNFLLLLIKS
jgi:hypothetical protein